MSIISRDEVKKLALLSRLPLDEAEISSYQEDLEEILEYVAKLSRVDTSSVSPVHGGGSGTNAFRADEAAPSSSALTGALTAAFPDSVANMAKVPPVIPKR
jgi:aspartyl-tRNA(Asn)/glutamyl-tRNA(Gln) amidotransferase subunit C